MIYHKNYLDIKENKVETDNSKGVSIRTLIAEDQGAKNFYMRILRIEKDGYSPYHKHEWEHENYILNGEGLLKTEDKDIKVKKGDVIFIPPNELHSYINTGDIDLEIMCLISSMF
ncbi:MAG TPA: cupin domain-containing protein [Methanofastidiosum sp.]|nr:cupin domain-containing protein [Methanofastidiosum sp.]